MNDELLKLITSTLDQMASNFQADADRMGAVLPGLSGVGFMNSHTATAFGDMLKHHHYQQFLTRQGPTATMLRQQARVGERLRQLKGTVFFEATVNNSLAAAEAAIVALSPFRGEAELELTRVLGELITPYLPYTWRNASAVDGEIHQGFNHFKPQSLQFKLDYDASPHGQVAFTEEGREKKPRYDVILRFRDPGGSRRDLSFQSGYQSYGLKNEIYDALEDVVYPGLGSHYTVDQLQETLEAVFTAAGWSRAVYEESQWSPEEWTSRFRNVRYAGMEPEPLTSNMVARQVADMQYGDGYFEWIDDTATLHWELKALGFTFSGQLSETGLPEAPVILALGRYGTVEGSWAIRPHCLPDLLDTLMEHRARYLERLRIYRARDDQLPDRDD